MMETGRILAEAVSGKAQSEKLQRLDWAVLTAKLAAARELRKAMQPASSHVPARFRDAGALGISDAPCGEPEINPEALGNRKSHGRIASEQGSGAGTGVRGRQ